LAKKKRKQKKNKQRDRDTFSFPQWYETGLGEWSTEKILSQLEEYGLDMDEGRFKQDAGDTSEPHVVADKWAEDVKRVSGRGEDFFHFSALELWKRLLPEKDTFGLLTEELTEHIDRGTDSPMAGEEVRDLMSLLDRVYLLLEKRAEQKGGDKKDLLDEIADRHGFEFGFFLIEQPFDLQRNGFVDEAISVARKFSFVDEGNMLGDLGNILSTSGRCQEALEQVEQNLKDLPDDPWVIIKAGDVYDECGEPDKAIGLFSKALGMMNDQYTRDGAYERLIPLYEKMGKVEEARVMREQWKEDQEESIIEPEPYSPQIKTLHSKKIGRNEPCPCGSGLKYKKCCLNKE